MLLERSDVPILDPKEDYPRMRSEIHCLLSDGMELPGFLFNIHNRGFEERSLQGAVSPWTRSENSEIERMKTMVVSDEDMITCATAKAMRLQIRKQSWIVGCVLSGLTTSGVLVTLFARWLENRKGRICL